MVNSRIFIVCTPHLGYWSVTIAEELHKLQPELRFSALLVGNEKMDQRFGFSASKMFDTVLNTESLTQYCMRANIEGEVREGLLRRYGRDSVRRLIIADRNVGHTYTRGVHCPSTPLSKWADSTAKQESFVLALLHYWETFLDKEPVRLVFCHGMAEATTLALYFVCQLRHIPDVTMPHSRVGNRYLLDTGLDCGNFVRSRFECSDFVPSDGSIAEAKAFLEQFRNSDPHPDYYAIYYQHKKDLGIYNKLKKVLVTARKEASKIIDSPLYAPNRVVGFTYTLIGGIRAIARNHSRTLFSSLESLDKPYLYFPLHMNPESSTLILAPDHIDQEKIIREMAANLPKNRLLAVKDHEPMLGLRPCSFYNNIQQLPNVRLIHPLCSGRDLIKNATVVITITGTSGLEALIHGKPLIMMGQPPYRLLNEGYIYEPDPRKIASAIERVIRLPKINQENLLRYLAILIEESFPFPSDRLWGGMKKEQVLKETTPAKHIAQKLHALFI